MKAIQADAEELNNAGLLLEGDSVDDVMKYSLGRRWNLVGPIASIDLGGLDVFYNISTYLFDDMDNGTGPSPLLAEKVKSGNLGAKTGRRISPTTVSGYIDEMIRNYLLFEATGC